MGVLEHDLYPFLYKVKIQQFFSNNSTLIWSLFCIYYPIGYGYIYLKYLYHDKLKKILTTPSLSKEASIIKVLLLGGGSITQLYYCLMDLH